MVSMVEVKDGELFSFVYSSCSEMLPKRLEQNEL